MADADKAGLNHTKRDYWNDLPCYFRAKVEEARARRKTALASIHSGKQVHDRIETIRRSVWSLIGGALEKTPLNPRIVGSLESKEYRIDKVIFESQPLVYVTANLYIPSTKSAPFPAVLFPMGHYPEGKSARNYQYVCQTLARLGYMVFAYDPFGQGERQQYLDPRTMQSRYGPTGEHDRAGWPLLLLGATFAQYRVWDGIRALDYLLSRPEVDSNRLGCVGHSGGATMTMYLCALEARIQAAVVVEGHLRNFGGPNYDPPGAIGDAEQNLVGSLAMGIDRGDLLWAFAPKPLLLCYTPQDAIERPSYLESVQEIFEELSYVYGLLGAKDRVRLFASFLPHDFDFFNRHESYRWFNQWFQKPQADLEEAEFESLPPNALNCTNTGQVLTSLGGRSVLQVNKDRAHSLAPSASFRGSGLDANGLRNRIRDDLRNLLAFPSHRCPLDPQLLASGKRGPLSIEEIEFRSEDQIRITGWFVKPHQGHMGLPVVAYIADEGKDKVVEEAGEMEVIVEQGFALFAIDLRGLGSASPRFPTSGPLFYYDGGQHLRDDYAWAGLILGRPLLGQRIWDFLRALDYLQTRSDVDNARIGVLAVAGSGLAALFAAALDDRPRSILYDHSPADLHSLLESEDYSLGLSWFVPGLLRRFDLPDLVAALAPRACWLLDAVDPRGEVLAKSVLQARFEVALKSYSKLTATGQLQFVVENEKRRSPTILSWLKTF